jgi:type VI secretion system protein ImpB
MFMIDEPADERMNRLEPTRIGTRLKVEIDGALREIVQAFKAGVLVNLGGNGGDGHFHEVTSETLDEYLASIGACETFEVANRLGGRDKIVVSLRFDSHASIEPDTVARQVKPISDLLDIRNRLLALKDLILHNAAAQDTLSEAITDHDLLVLLAALADQISPDVDDVVENDVAALPWPEKMANAG